ncbi:flavin-dependent dehydrogenase [Streptomyces sp. 2333.5]|uniref:FAD-dependent oxidoreductase n=1 Tax=unclassified Streptomyces TaxID=2593676 RepID=UPI000899A4D7|nr:MULTISPECIES: NAD(P)/FAD-dependent oxidoreductase [unclassified Streptomyces]PJI99852.1 flavin-dependent dehydrogenase [Streptomyces sp. 2333.5]SEB61755.1 Dehydrogenase (flavoprotein) [Streptomyces sp. 2314.4]SEC45018.1 Dehydrogenase (flavoprotein) [Streptomyces sp. 2112.2]
MTTARLSHRLGATDSADVLVVGAGLAGLNTATLLARQGHDVLLVERRTSLAGAIRTTGIFVRKTLDDFPLPADCLGPPIRRVVLYPPDLRRPISLTSPRDEYRVGDMAPLYEASAATAVDAGVRIALGTRYAGRQGNAFHLAGRDGPTTVRARFVVGADGARSRVARDLALDRNHHLIVGAEEVFEIPGSDQPPTFHCVLDPSLAPGYLAWVVNDGQHVHVGVAGYADRYPDGLRRAMERFSASAPGLTGVERPETVERRAGPIPVGGLLRRISCADGLLVGDAAGAVSPLTAGGLDPCLRQSKLAAEVLNDALRTGNRDTMIHYDGAALRPHFRGRLTLRRVWSHVRTPATAAAAFPLLRTPFGRAAASRVLFGDRSFPDPTPK